MKREGFQTHASAVAAWEKKKREIRENAFRPDPDWAKEMAMAWALDMKWRVQEKLVVVGEEGMADVLAALSSAVLKALKELED